MEMKVSTGFPLRRCSWSYSPIVSATLTRRIIRWLDLVCVRPRQVQGISHDDSEHRYRNSGQLWTRSILAVLLDSEKEN
jgi:hypothetical protein